MKWLKIVLELIAKGLEWWHDQALLQAGAAQEKEKENAETIKALEARDAVTDDNAAKFLLSPDER